MKVITNRNKCYMHTIIKIAVVSVLALFAIVGVVSVSKAEVINLELKCDGRIVG